MPALRVQVPRVMRWPRRIARWVTRPVAWMFGTEGTIEDLRTHGALGWGIAMVLAGAMAFEQRDLLYLGVGAFCLVGILVNAHLAIVPRSMKRKR